MLKLFKRRRPAHRAGVMTPREVVARMLYSEHVHGSQLDLLNYDHTPRLQALWQAEADLHLAVSKEDRDIASHFKIAVGEWIRMSALAKVDAREQYAKEMGMAV